MTLTSRTRQVTAADFDRFDLVVAMDAANRQDLLRLAPDDAARSKVRMLLDHTDRPGDVPDPYHGGEEGFAAVVRVVREGAAGLARAIRESRVSSGKDVVELPHGGGVPEW